MSPCGGSVKYSRKNITFVVPTFFNWKFVLFLGQSMGDVRKVTFDRKKTYTLHRLRQIFVMEHYDIMGFSSIGFKTVWMNVL